MTVKVSNPQFRTMMRIFFHTELLGAGVFLAGEVHRGTLGALLRKKMVRFSLPEEYTLELTETGRSLLLTEHHEIVDFLLNTYGDSVPSLAEQVIQMVPAEELPVYLTHRSKAVRGYAKGKIEQPQEKGDGDN